MVEAYIVVAGILGVLGLIITVGCAIIGATDDGPKHAFTYGSQGLAMTLLIAGLWPVWLVSIIPAFLIWGGFNLARAAKHGDFDPDMWD